VKALTVRQPWAAHIIHSGKDVENRSQRTNYRGTVAIHAGLQLDKTQVAIDPTLAHEPLPRGAVIGTVDIVGCHHSDTCTSRGQHDACTEWGQADAWHWELDNPRALPEPIPAKGRLGLWDWERP